MDKKEAQFILSAYRPSGQDADDSQISAALKMANQRSGSESLVRIRGCGRTRSSRTNSSNSRPPSGLRSQILAGMNMAESPPLVATITGHGHRRVHHCRLRSDAFLEPPNLRFRFRRTPGQCGQLFRRVHQSGFLCRRSADLATWLKEQGCAGSVDLAGQLESMPGIGCRTLSWSRQDGFPGLPAGGYDLSCFMVDRDEVPDMPDLRRAAVLGR